MANYKINDVSYNMLHNESNVPEEIRINVPIEENEHEDTTGVIIHSVPESNRGGWTHVEDLDTFFTRMYRYYLKGGFFAMLVSDTLQLFQYTFVIYFVTFLVHCVNYPVLFGKGNISSAKINNITFSDIVYPKCPQRVTFVWWLLICLCSIVGLVKMARSFYHLFHAYDIKLFYNNGLKIEDEDLGWLSWCSVQNKVKDAQRELQMCIHKQQITELDIYHRILRFDNYMVAMVNKRLLPLSICIPCIGEVPYLSKGLKYNLELLLFYNPWSPWENCWQLRDSYKDASKRLVLARQLENHILVLTILNGMFAPLILAWQILYFSFNYAALIKRSPESFGLRTWSLYGRILLRHFNELDHELSDRLNRAYKPATKYLASFPSPITTIIAKTVAFLCASILGVIIILSLYNETVLTVEHMLTVITVLTCVLAIARSLIPDESVRQRSSEELLVQVLGHVHYLPTNWKGKAHTRDVAAHFQELFQFRAVYILIELFSPLICPFILYSLKSRALDIVDFYRNFTVSVLDIGDVCSFAQMDVRKHGNPEWPAGKELEEHNVCQYNQGEDGKTELSLVAFSCRNPGWRAPYPSQQKYLQTLHRSIVANSTTNPFAYQNNLSQRTSVFVRSGLLYNKNFLDSEDNKEQQQDRCPIIHDKAESLNQEEQDLSISALHLYNMHIARTSNRVRSVEPTPHTSGISGFRRPQNPVHSNEDTPLLRKTRP